MKKTLKIIGVYFIAFVLPLGLDRVTDLIGVRPYDHRDAWYHAIFKVGFWYQRLVTLSPRKPRVHFVRIVTLRAGKEPPEVMGQNLCGERGQRAFTARLLLKLELVNPAVIVVDKFYGPKSCPQDDRGTEELHEALAHVSQDIPIILGREALSEREIEKDSPETLRELKKRGFSSKDQLAVPSLRFEEGDPPSGISYGFLTLNFEVRKIPLRWMVYESQDEVGQKGYPNVFPTLAMVAAQRYDHDAGTDLKRHPFTSFLSEEEFQPRSAMDIVCDPSTAAVQDWRTCPHDRGSKPRLADFTHRIVLVGEYNRRQDFHESPIGEVPGLLLQANYIESLLDDRYLKPVALWLVVALSAVWFFTIEWVFKKQESSPWTALLYAASVSAVFGLCFYVIAVVNLGYYLNLLPTGFLAVFLRWILALVVEPT